MVKTKSQSLLILFLPLLITRIILFNVVVIVAVFVIVAILAVVTCIYYYFTWNWAAQYYLQKLLLFSWLTTFGKNVILHLTVDWKMKTESSTEIFDRRIGKWIFNCIMFFRRYTIKQCWWLLRNFRSSSFFIPIL